MRKHTIPTPLVSSEKELSEFLLKQVGESLKEAIRSSVSVLVKTEMQQLRTELFEKEGLSLQFNGAYGRNLTSPVGRITDIPIPRFRSGNGPHGLKSLDIFDDERHRFHELVANLHAAGISQKKIDRLCRSVFGIKMPPAKTKEVFEELLEQEAFRVNERPLLDEPCDVIFLDGVWHTVKSRKTGETRKRVTLTAVGMSLDGAKKTLLGFSLAFEEDEASWIAFLESLLRRGVRIAQSKLAVVDGGGGCIAALERLAPGLDLQVCLSHRYRNVLKHTPRKLKHEMGSDLKRLTQSGTAEAFTRQVKRMEERWALIAPKAVASLVWKLPMSMAYFSFPKELWQKIRTTNAIDRMFREVRSRTRTHYDHYESPESAEKYHQAVFGEINKSYFKTPSPSEVIHTEV